MAASAVAAGLDRRAARAPPRPSISLAIAILGCAAAAISFTLAVAGEASKPSTADSAYGHRAGAARA
jgi:hypothetical protein